MCQSTFWGGYPSTDLFKGNDVIDCTYSDVPLLDKVNLFIRRSELTYSPATYIIYLIGLVILTACTFGLPFWEWIPTTRSLCAIKLHKLQILPALISSLVVIKAVQYINTSYNYYNAQVSMGKAAVHCTSTQSLHCETRNKKYSSRFSSNKSRV